jgi:hypothetical protein
MSSNLEEVLEIRFRDPYSGIEQEINVELTVIPHPKGITHGFRILASGKHKHGIPTIVRFQGTKRNQVRRKFNGQP